MLIIITAVIVTVNQVSDLIAMTDCLICFLCAKVYPMDFIILTGLKRKTHLKKLNNTALQDYYTHPSVCVNVERHQLSNHCLLFQDWHHSCMKGCFFLEEDGSISSLQYCLTVTQTTSVYLTIQPLSLSQRPGATISCYIQIKS